MPSLVKTIGPVLASLLSYVMREESWLRSKPTTFRGIVISTYTTVVGDWIAPSQVLFLQFRGIYDMAAVAREYAALRASSCRSRLSQSSLITSKGMASLPSA